MNSQHHITIKDQDVIHLKSSIQSLRFPQTFRSDELLRDIVERLMVHRNEQAKKDKKEFVASGIECEILQTSGQGWKKGKFRLSLEFIPDSENKIVSNAEFEIEGKQLNELNSFRDSIE